MILRCALILSGILCYSLSLSAQERFSSPLLLTESEEGIASDNPTARIAWDAERLHDPNTDQIPDGIAARQMEFAATLPKKNPFALKGMAPSSLLWQPAGPINIGGRTRAFAIDVADPNNMVAGAAAGGAWRSIDGGASWVKTTAPNDIQNVTCVAQDTRPGKQNIWYYGSGELLSTTARRVDTIHRTMALGDGIFKSTDNGASWRQLPATRTNSTGALREFFQGVWRIAINPTATANDEVFAACFGALMKSTDGGASWNRSLGNSDNPAFNTEIQITSGGIFYAALGSRSDMSPATDQGVWRSVNGTNWTKISPPNFPSQVRRTVIAITPSNQNILYVLTETPYLQESYGFTSSLHSLWRYTYLSGDGSGNGGKWENLTAVFPRTDESLPPHYTDYNTLGGYCMAMGVNPDNPDNIVLGGVHLFFTTDGFASLQVFKDLFVANTIIPHPDNHVILFHRPTPDNPLLYMASDGGIIRTNRISVDSVPWELMNKDYRSTMFYSVGIDHKTAGSQLIIGGLQDNGSAYSKPEFPANAWKFISYGDGCASAIANNEEAIYVTAQFGAMGSFVYNSSTGNYDQTPFRSPVSTSSSDYNFVTLFELEPNDTHIMYLPAKNRLWRHNDLANIPPISIIDNQWVELTNVQTGGASITALDASTEPRGRLYFGTNDGRVFRIDGAEQGNPPATDVSGSNFVPGAFVSSISVDPRNADKVLIAYSNYGVQSLFYTEDGGSHWVPVAGNLEEHLDGSGAGPSVRGVKILPISNGTLFLAGTSVGLYSTPSLTGTRTTWEQEGETTIGSVIVEAIDAREIDGRIVIGSQGNGVFTTNYLSSVDQADAEGADDLLLEQNFPNPADGRTGIRFHLPQASFITLTLHDATGKEIATLFSEKREAGTYIVELDTEEQSLSGGTYFYRLKTEQGSATRMMKIVR